MNTLIIGKDATGANRPVRTDSVGNLTLGNGVAYSSDVTITRPANVTAYTAGDTLGGVITIPAIGQDGALVYITDVSLMPQITAIPSGMAGFTLHLYNATPPSALADNAAWTLGGSDRALYLGSVNVGTPALLGTGTQTAYVQQTSLAKGIKMPVGSTSLYAYLVTAGGFTPAANSEVYLLNLKSVVA